MTAKEKSSSPTKILLIDDEPTTLIIGQFLIQELGYEFKGFNNSQEALSQLEETPGKFDLVITDYLMPFIKGDDLSRRLQKINPRVPIILLTGIYDFDTEVLQKDGISEIVYKPYEPNDLISAIDRCLGKTSP